MKCRRRAARRLAVIQSSLGSRCGPRVRGFGTPTQPHTHRSCPFASRAVFSPNGMPALRCLARPLRCTRRIRAEAISAFSRRRHEIFIDIASYGSRLRGGMRFHAIERTRTDGMLFGDRINRAADRMAALGFDSIGGHSARDRASVRVQRSTRNSSQLNHFRD